MGAIRPYTETPCPFGYRSQSSALSSQSFSNEARGCDPASPPRRAFQQTSKSAKTSAMSLALSDLRAGVCANRSEDNGPWVQLHSSRCRPARRQCSRSGAPRQGKGCLGRDDLTPLASSTVQIDCILNQNDAHFRRLWLTGPTTGGFSSTLVFTPCGRGRWSILIISDWF